jgi:hypothetical protein
MHQTHNAVQARGSPIVADSQLCYTDHFDRGADGAVDRAGMMHSATR